jgi:hypothetical protein
LTAAIPRSSRLPCPTNRTTSNLGASCVALALGASRLCRRAPRPIDTDGLLSEHRMRQIKVQSILTQVYPLHPCTARYGVSRNGKLRLNLGSARRGMNVGKIKQQKRIAVSIANWRISQQTLLVAGGEWVIRVPVTDLDTRFA